MRTVLINGTIVTMNQKEEIYSNGYLVIDDSFITELGNGVPSNQEGTVIDLKGKIVFPGLINTHTHLGMIPFRSMADDQKDRLRKFLFPMEKQYMNKDLAVLSSRYAVLECIRSGTTTIADMYYFEDAIATALEEIGVRAFCGQTIIDEVVIDPVGQEFENLEQFILKWKDHPFIQPMLAPHGTSTVNAEKLVQLSDLSKKHNIKMMMHVSEMDYEMNYFKEEFDMTPIEFLGKKGILDSNLISVHTIHTSENDLKLLGKHNVKVAHCITANMKSGKGIMDLKGMQGHGINISLGTDGPISGNTLDLFTQMRLVPMAQKVKNQDRSFLTSKEVCELATINGARTLGIEELTGSLEVGKVADLIVIETDSLNMFPLHDIYAVLVYSTQAQNVESVMIHGKWVLWEKEFVSIDERKVKEDLKQETRKMSSHYQKELLQG